LKKTALLIAMFSFVVASAIVVSTKVNAANGQPAGVSIAGPQGLRVEKLPAAGRTTQVLFRGDMSAEQGIGCSNGTGTTGGPNDVAVNVVASGLTFPFGLTIVTYNIFTQVSPNITAHSFAAWSSVSGAGTVIDSEAGAPFSQGNHTFVPAFPGIYPISQNSFFFGFQQPQTNVGMRWGVDTSAGGGTSYIRAPTCGLSSFGTLDSIGFPGNWVFRTTADDTVPVELYDFSVE
jgi:hypothetical protein